MPSKPILMIHASLFENSSGLRIMSRVRLPSGAWFHEKQILSNFLAADVTALQRALLAKLSPEHPCI